MRKAKLLIASLLVAITTNVHSQGSYMPSPENLEARKWFQDAKFGLFIHWGVYSVLGDGEWVMNNKQIDKPTYEKLPAFFNPTAFDAAEWVKLAKEAGMKYITITSKHHDGFAMWDTKLTDWSIVKRTPYSKDIIKQLADECHKQGLKLFLYHSQLDWYHNDYYPRGRTGLASGRPHSGNWYNYLDFMDGQLTELLTNYGKIAGIWFDGWWDKRDADWRLDKTYSLIHKLQPAALIGSNHHQTPKAGEDIQMFEKDLPGKNTTGFRDVLEIGNLPLETCETMNDSWGFNLRDHNYKSTKQLIQYLVKAAGSNANFLLNVGPMPDGRIQPEFIRTLGEVGDWMNVYGESIYETRGGPESPKSWGVTTAKDNKVYIHILNSESESIVLENIKSKVKKAYFFDDKSRVALKQDGFGTTIKIPVSKLKEFDTIIVLEL